MEIDELRKLNLKELKKKKDEVIFLLMGAHRGVKPLVPIGKTKQMRKTIARIETLIKEKEKNAN